MLIIIDEKEAFIQSKAQKILKTQTELRGRNFFLNYKSIYTRVVKKLNFSFQIVISLMPIEIE